MVGGKSLPAGLDVENFADVGVENFAFRRQCNAAVGADEEVETELFFEVFMFFEMAGVGDEAAFGGGVEGFAFDNFRKIEQLVEVHERGLLCTS